MISLINSLDSSQAQNDKPKSAVKVITDYIKPGNNLERISPAPTGGGRVLYELFLKIILFKKKSLHIKNICYV